jgi:hypothetical protein
LRYSRILYNHCLNYKRMGKQYTVRKPYRD